MRSTRRLTSLLMGAALLTSALGTGAAAQDATDSPGVPQDCGVLTADEVSAALGMTLTVASGDGVDCEFDADLEKLEFLSLFTSMDAGTAADIKDIMCSALGTSSPDPSAGPCAIDLTIGNQPATYLPEAMGTLLYIETGTGGLLLLQLIGDLPDGVDRQAALTGLGELAMPRAAAVPMATAQPIIPGATFEGDADLEALFPTEVGGRSVTIQSLSANDLTAQGIVTQPITDALSGIGKSVNDLRVGIGYVIGESADHSASITAFQVKGADMPSSMAALMPVLTADQTVEGEAAVQVAGKDMTSATVEGTLTYYYPRNDILWVVTAVDPTLTEIFQKLP